MTPTRPSSCSLRLDLGERQAEGVTQAIRTAQDAHLQELATKKDLLEVKMDIKNATITLGALMIGLFGLAIAWFELRGG